ncbi:MAG: sigma 54-interacting transcriptional regulator [Acidobacteriota bacterium]
MPPPDGEAGVARASLQKWNAEVAFRPIVEATADKAGLDFLRALVKNLAESLAVDHAFVAEFAGTSERVRTIAFWSGGDWRDNVEYALAGTPCEQVVAGQRCLFKDEVQQLFPRDSDLATLGVRSYLGLPLKGAQGQTLGHLAALDSRPMDEDPRGMAIFDVFANRARVEMERLHAEAVLRRACNDLEVGLQTAKADLESAHARLDLAYGELKALLEINQSSTRHLRRADLFAELARSVKPLLRCERFGIEVPIGPEHLRVHVLALDQPARGPMIEEFPSAGTVCRWAQEQRQWFVGAARDDLRARFPRTWDVMAREGMESVCALPLIREERSFGALFFMSTSRDAYRDIPVPLLERVASAVAVAVDHCFAYERLAELRDRLEVENVYLREEIQQAHDFQEIVGRSPAMTKLLATLHTVAATPATVLILGETGTGKELVARAIHERSARRDRPLVKVNCAAIPPGLVESELFGHVRGAFTGAISARTGRFEVAHGGTIFLDEVGELPAEAQAKLLRVLQEREIEPVGSHRTRKVDVRVIAATNRDLAAEVAAGRFRADLYFRLNVVPLTVPPLRERAGDVELLAHVLAERFAREFGKRVEGISPASLDRLAAYHWPGNVRELANLVERAVVLADGPILELGADLVPAGPARAPGPAPGDTLEDVERRHIKNVLDATGGIVEGPAGAAARLGLNPSTLRSRMKKLGIARPRR